MFSLGIFPDSFRVCFNVKIYEVNKSTKSYEGKFEVLAIKMQRSMTSLRVLTEAQHQSVFRTLTYLWQPFIL